MTTSTPVLDTIIDINAASIEHSQLSPREMMLARLAAMVAVDAPPASYMANARPSIGSGITQQDVQEVMIAVAPIVGTAKVVSAGGNMLRALDMAITVADDDAL
jgi:Carboxymuconolactone decarboxylase family